MTHPPHVTHAAATGELVEPLEGPVAPTPERPDHVVTPRMARHWITLENGHEVGISVAGRGIPLVVIHGFSAEGFLYAQTLSRLVSMGFKVIAIDTAGHGGTQGLPADGANIKAYSEFLSRALDELGIRSAILAGHSMGGRLVTQVAAEHPDQVMACILVDAIVGDTWDRMVYLFRVFPGLLVALGGALLVDSASVAPVFSDPRQAVKLLRLVTPTLADRAVRPWRLLGPGLSILRSRSSRYALDAARRSRIPFFVIHGDRDFGIPLRTAEDAARRSGGTLVVVKGGGHSWILKDPETLPGIVAELWQGRLKDACHAALGRLGVVAETASLDELERACYEPDAWILGLTPRGKAHRERSHHHRPRYRWSILHPEEHDPEPVDAFFDGLPENVSPIGSAPSVRDVD